MSSPHSPAMETTSLSDYVTLTASEGRFPKTFLSPSPTVETASCSNTVTVTTSKSGSPTASPELDDPAANPEEPMVVKIALKPPQRVGHTAPRRAPLVTPQHLTHRTPLPQHSST